MSVFLNFLKNSAIKITPTDDQNTAKKRIAAIGIAVLGAMAYITESLKNAFSWKSKEVTKQVESDDLKTHKVSSEIFALMNKAKISSRLSESHQGLLMRSSEAKLSDLISSITSKKAQSIKLSEEEFLDILSQKSPSYGSFYYSGPDFMARASALQGGFEKTKVVAGLRIFDQLERDLRRFPVLVNTGTGEILNLAVSKTRNSDEDVSIIKDAILPHLSGDKKKEVLETALNLVQQTTIAASNNLMSALLREKNLIITQGFDASSFTLQVIGDSIKVSTMTNYSVKTSMGKLLNPPVFLNLGVELKVTPGANGPIIKSVEYSFEKKLKK